MMKIDFSKPVLFDATNNGYMVTLENGWPYEVLEVDPGCQWPNLWPDVQAWLAAGNTAQPYVPPAPVPMDPEVQLNAEIMASLVEEAKKKPEWQARFSELKAKQEA
jgi:hypothetical protein